MGRDSVTDVAWPRSDGTIAILSRDEVQGNNLGAPAASCFPFDTRWVAMVNREKKIGMAMPGLPPITGM